MKPHLPFVLFALVSFQLSSGADLNGGTQNNVTLDDSDNALANSSSVAGTLTGILQLNANATIGGTGNITLSGTIQGAHTLTKIDANTISFTAMNAMNTGIVPTAFIIEAGQVNFNTNNVFGGSKGASAAGIPTITLKTGATLHSTRFNILGNLVMDGGTLSQDSSDNSSSYKGWEFLGNVHIKNNATISSTNNKLNMMGKGAHTFTVDTDKTLTMTAGLTDGSGDNAGAAQFIKDGGGTILISNKDTSYSFSGGTIIKQGTLKLGTGVNTESTWNFGTGNIAIENGGTLHLHLSANGVTTMNNSFTLKEGGKIYINDGRYALQNMDVSGGTTGATIEMYWDKSLTINGILSGNGLLKFVTSYNYVGNMRTLTLGNNANTFSGTLQMDASGIQNTLELKANGAAALATIDLRGGDTNKIATLNINTGNATVAGLQGNQHSKIISTGGSRTLTVNGGGIFAGILGSNLDLVKSGQGTLELSGFSAGSFNGIVSIQEGTLLLSNANALGNWTRLNISHSSTLQLNLAAGANFTVGSGQTLALEGTGATIHGNLHLNGGTIDWTLGSTPSEASSPLLNLTGGNLSISNNSTFNFILTDKVLGNGLYWLATASGSYDLGSISLQGLFEGGRQTYQLTNNGADGNIYLLVEGQALNLAWNQGSGTWSTSTGSTPWNDGSGANFFATGDIVTFGEIDGQDNSTITLEGSLTPGKVTVSSSETNYTFDGAGSISGAALLLKEGSADLTIQNANSYDGGTQLNGGRLIVQNVNALGTGDVAIGQNGTLQLNKVISNTLSGNGNLIINWGEGTTGTTAMNSFSGSLTLKSGAWLTAATTTTQTIDFDGGTLKLSSGGALNATLNALNSNIIQIDQNGQNLTLGGTIAGDVNIVGAGTLGFNLSSSYAGTITAQTSGKTIRVEHSKETYSKLGQANFVFADNTTLIFASDGGVDWSSSTGSITLGADSKIQIENPLGRLLNIYNHFILNAGSTGTVYFDGATMGNSGTYFGKVSGQGNLVIRSGSGGRANSFAFKNGWIHNDYTGTTSVERDMTFSVTNSVSTTNKHITPFGVYTESEESISSGIGILTNGITFNLTGNTGGGTTHLDNAIRFMGGNTLNLADLGTLHLTKSLQFNGSATINYNPTSTESKLIIDGALSGGGNFTLSGNASTLKAELAGAGAGYSGNIILGAANKSVALEVSGENALGSGGLNLVHENSSVTFSNNQTITGKITGAGSVNINAGEGKIVNMNGVANDYAGETTISSGTAKAGNDSAFGSGSISISGGTLDANNKTLTNNINIGLGKIANLGTQGSAKAISITSTASGNIQIDNSFISVADMNTALNQTILLDNGSEMLVTGNSTFVISAANILNATVRNGSQGIISVSENSSLVLTGHLTLNFTADAFAAYTTEDSTLAINLFNILQGGSVDLLGLNQITFTGGGADSWLVLNKDTHSSVFEQLKQTGFVDITFDGAPPTGAHPSEPIPEPSSSTLALLGLSSLLLRRKRR